MVTRASLLTANRSFTNLNGSTLPDRPFGAERQIPPRPRDAHQLKRTFSLAIQAGLLTTRPYLQLLAEQHVRTGFFKRDELDRITQHLLASMRGIAAFAFITGWRTPS